MKLIYIAGPYSAPDSWEREQNIRRAEAVSLAVMHTGAATICVHTMSRYWFGQVSEELAIAADMELLHRSDAVVLVEGWGKSTGTLAEIAEAAKLGIPTYDSVQDFRDNRVLNSSDAYWAATRWTEIQNEARRKAGPVCKTCGEFLGNDAQSIRLGFCSGTCARARAPFVVDAGSPLKAWPTTGTLCSVCYEPQFRTPSGTTCTNGHYALPKDSA